MRGEDLSERFKGGSEAGGTALLAGAQPRAGQSPAREQTRCQLCRDRRAARPRCFFVERRTLHGCGAFLF